MTERRVFRAILSMTIAAAVLAPRPVARAQDYPTRAVKIIVPFPAGGTADAMPRLIGDWLSRKWGHPIVIENRTGAGGNIGAEAAFKAPPDGYTLLSTPAPPLVINQNLYPKLGSAPALTDLVSGAVDIMFDNLGVSLTLVKAGQLKLIAVAAAKRMASLPDVPAISETLPGFESAAWYAMAAPPKTPKAIIDK